MIYALALTGPTASGKTALSLEIAERLGCEIISCDSMQVYKKMNIGTAKATAIERARVPHHMIDFLSPRERYSAEDYAAAATRVAEEIVARGKIPLFVGGTGLYIDTVMRGGVLESPPSDPALREALTREAEQKGNEHMWNRLREVDSASAEKIHMNNLRRVIRALEIYELSGKTKAYFDSLTAKESDIIRVGMITLDFYSRENLYSRVDRRVDIMMEEGLLDEVRSLYEAGLLGEETTAAQAIGYKELKGYLEGRVTLEEALEELKLASRRYAKRQLTWFRRERAYRLMIDTVEGKMKGSEELICEAVDAAERLLSEIMSR